MRGQGSRGEHARSLVCKYCILFRVYSVVKSKGVLPGNKVVDLASLEESFTLNENPKLKWKHFTQNRSKLFCVSPTRAPQAIKKLVPLVGTSKQLSEDRRDLMSRETVFEETRTTLPPHSCSHRHKERFGGAWQSLFERLYHLKDGENRERNPTPGFLSFCLWDLRDSQQDWELPSTSSPSEKEPAF